MKKSNVRIEGDQLRGNLEMLIMASLTTGRLHGYQVTQDLVLRSAGRIDVQEGSLYPALHRMERQKLIRGRWEAGQAGPRRRVYELTAKGERAYSQNIFEWKQARDAISAVIGQ